MQMLDAMLGTVSRAKSEFLASLTPIIIMGRGHSGTRILSKLCAALGVNLGVDEDAPAGDVSDERFQNEIKKIAVRSLGVTSPQQVQPDDLRRFQRAVYSY